jgi:hypothetical protein
MHRTVIGLRHRVGKTIMCSGFLVFILFSATFCFAANYSCGNASANHCYGQTSWSEKTQYFGSYVDRQEPPMNCPSNCGGFIDNEMWLIDTNSAGCTAKSIRAMLGRCQKVFSAHKKARTLRDACFIK